MLKNFDPVHIEHDRRMLYEVTGMRLYNNEFLDESSSNSEGEDPAEELLPIDYAFMERFSDEDDGDSRTS